MRRLALSALMLSPVILHAQANLSTGTQAMLHAAAIPRQGLNPFLTEAADAAGDSDSATTTVASDKIQTVITTNIEAAQEFAYHDAELTGDHGFSFDGPDAVFEAPKLVHWAPIQCVESDLDAADASSKKLLLSMVISQTGKPTEIKVIHSVDPVLDHKAVDALSQYRFTPATLGHHAAAAPATVAINFPSR